MATWPTTLPAPSLEGYGLETQDQTVRTEMEGGAARVRRRTTTIPDRFTLRLSLSVEQMATFRAFWAADWQHGAAWVFIPLKDGTAATAQPRECRPVPATYKAWLVSATRWSVEITVEVRNA